jgi:putative ATP-binding cassette transporter
MNEHGMRGVLREAWGIARPYWVSEERWRALGLLVLVVMLSLGQVALNVRFSYWYNAFYNTLQNLDAHGFYVQIALFAGLATLWVLIGTSRGFLSQMLRIRWRRWLTDLYLKRWLDHRAYYRLQLTGLSTDNPDQRIAEDVRDFVDSALALSLGLLSSIVSFFSFVFILWSLSGPLTIPLGFLGAVTIPAYMVWLVIVYVVVGTFVTTRIGRPLIGLNFNQQRYEADFRYSLVRLRENTESVAFYRGEDREFDVSSGRFRHVVDNFWAIMWRSLKVNGFTFSFGQASVLFPYLVQAPRFFAKQIRLGDLQQTGNAFNQVVDALSFIINAFGDIAMWFAVVRRLSTFDTHVAEIIREPQASGTLPVVRQGTGSAGDLASTCRTADRLPHRSASPAPRSGGQATGIGKSTVLRRFRPLAVRPRCGLSRIFFVSPYPLGSLRRALAYPGGTAIPDERLGSCRRSGSPVRAEARPTGSRPVGATTAAAFARRWRACVIFLARRPRVRDTEAVTACCVALASRHRQRHRSTCAFHDRVLDLSARRIGALAVHAGPRVRGAELGCAIPRSWHWRDTLRGGSGSP